MNKRFALKLLNIGAYWTSCWGTGFALGRLVNKFFGEFLRDEAYAEQHPYKFFFGALLIAFVELGIGLTLVWWPLLKLWRFLDDKIDKFADDHEWD